MQSELIATTDLSTFDEHARHLAILGAGLDRRWREQLECPAILERLTGRRMGWLASVSAPPRARTPWELPEQLRYLERLTPRTPPPPMAMPPRGGWR